MLVTRRTRDEHASLEAAIQRLLLAKANTSNDDHYQIHNLIELLDKYPGLDAELARVMVEDLVPSDRWSDSGEERGEHLPEMLIEFRSPAGHHRIGSDLLAARGT